MESAKKYLNGLKENLDILNLEEINKIIDILLKAYKENKQIFIMGNGGSAALASHFACDLGKGTLQNVYNNKEKRFRVMSLTDNVALMTAFSNDLNYEHVFSQQLNNLVKEGDVVIGISASGNSQNVINAINLAKENKAATIAFLGFDGGKLKNLVDFKILVNNNHYGIVEDVHSVLEHMICSIIRERLAQI
ncbi:MAG: SIS domain-containing protein [Nanoarchaeota archaeon]|nr:SIS domain-containing protein [Nanoarchaeota archaeon]